MHLLQAVQEDDGLDITSSELKFVILVLVIVVLCLAAVWLWNHRNRP